MRVIKSRFGTSKCSKCGGTIDPGVRIARPQGEQGRGGWAHVQCMVEDVKAEKGGLRKGKGGWALVQCIVEEGPLHLLLNHLQITSPC
jgi:hypothetical protein